MSVLYEGETEEESVPVSSNMEFIPNQDRRVTSCRLNIGVEEDVETYAVQLSLHACVEEGEHIRFFLILLRVQ